MTNGPALRKFRKAHRGVTAAQVAERLGVVRQTVHTYERAFEIDEDLERRYIEAVRDIANNKGA